MTATKQPAGGKAKKALLVLIFFGLLTAAGRVLTLNEPGNFWYGLLYHVALAATIGGLADWFAVTALFRRPLGIGWRTEILKKNRQRIMEALVDFCGRDLLGVEKIKGIINRESISDMMISYINEKGGKEKISAAVEAAGVKTLASIDIDRLARELSPVITNIIASIPTGKLVQHGLNDMTDREIGGPDTLASYAAGLGRELLHAKETQQVLLSEAEGLRRDYTAGGAMREMALSMAGLSPERIRELMNDAADKKLAEMAQKGTEAHEQLAGWISQRITAAETEGKLTAILTEKQQELATPELIAGLLASMMRQSFGSGAGDSAGSLAWREHFRTLTAEKLAEFAGNKVWQARLDEFVKEYLAGQLEAHHDFIIDLIRQRLDELSDEELIELSENYVADDLQIIRINGSVVGGMAGGLLYVIVSMAGRLVAA
ncbi:MAG: DUF445 domain-containing protein [Selenomonadaceae bacterium]|nr:DUF445 domain-containing protein [Selenomonadaceae bacterium]